MEKKKYNSKNATSRIGKVGVAAIISLTIIVMIALFVICESRWHFANKDAVLVFAEVVAFYTGYKSLMAFVRWGDKKGIL